MASSNLPMALLGLGALAVVGWLVARPASIPAGGSVVTAPPGDQSSPPSGDLYPGATVPGEPITSRRKPLPAEEVQDSEPKASSANPQGEWLLRVRIAEGYAGDATYSLSRLGTFGGAPIAVIARGVAEFPGLPSGSRWELEVVTASGETSAEQVLIPGDSAEGEELLELFVTPTEPSFPVAWLVDESGFPIAFEEVTVSAAGRRVKFTTDEVGRVRFESFDFLRAVEEIEWSASRDGVELVGSQRTVVEEDQLEEAHGILSSRFKEVRLGRVVLRPRPSSR